MDRSGNREISRLPHGSRRRGDRTGGLLAAAGALACAAGLAAPTAAPGLDLPSPGVESPLAAGAGDQVEPVLSAPWAAYTDRGTTPSSIRVLVLPDTPIAIRDGAFPRHAPDLRGSVLAFVEDGPSGSRIWRYDVLGGALEEVTPGVATGTQARPALGESLVAWEDDRAGDVDVWIDDRQRGSTYALRAPGIQQGPRAAGRLVAFVDAGAGSSVRLHDVSLGTLRTLIAGPVESADFDGNVLAVATGGPGSDVEVYDAAGGKLAALALPGRQRNPRASRDWIAFEDLSTGTSRVVLWEWATGQLIAPPAGTGTQLLGSLSYPLVVYADDRGGDFDVYLYNPQAPVPPPPPRPDGGTDGGVPDGGADGGVPDGGTDGGVPDGGTDGGPPDGGTDGGVPDGGADGGVPDGGTDGGLPDGGWAASCGDVATPLASLEVVRGRSDPAAGIVEFEWGAPMRVWVCIEADRVSSAWVAVNDRVVAAPCDFHRQVTGLERSSTVVPGKNRLGAILAGQPGTVLRVRLLPAAPLDGSAAAAHALRGAPETGGQGCATGLGGTISAAILASAALFRRRPR